MYQKKSQNLSFAIKPWSNGCDKRVIYILKIIFYFSPVKRFTLMVICDQRPKIIFLWLPLFWYKKLQSHLSPNPDYSMWKEILCIPFHHQIINLIHSVVLKNFYRTKFTLVKKTYQRSVWPETQHTFKINGFCSSLNSKKCFKICYLLCIRKPK